jgi:catechol 2,3-dioxygenase-like lactoylglutathione lyase family enzyme
MMVVRGILHCAIRAADLDVTLRFYEQVLGLKQVPRPKGLTFPGAWLAVAHAPGQALLHLYAGSAALGRRRQDPRCAENSAVDHIALLAQGFTGFRARFEQLGISAREQNLDGGSIWQMFVHDPNGIKIELSFEQADEPDLPVAIAPERRYRASERFFALGEYQRLG